MTHEFEPERGRSSFRKIYRDADDKEILAGSFLRAEHIDLRASDADGPEVVARTCQRCQECFWVVNLPTVLRAYREGQTQGLQEFRSKPDFNRLEESISSCTA